MAAPEPPVHKDRVHFLLRPTACPSPRAPTPQGTGDLLFGSQQRSPSFLRQQRNTFSANTLFIEGSPKTRPPQGIQNALSWNVNARAAQGWVLSVHSEDAGGQHRPRAGRPTWPGGGGGAVEGPGDQESSSRGPCLQPCTIPPGNAYCRQTSRIITSPQLHTAAGAADAQAWGRPLGSRIPETTVSGTTHGGNEKGAFRDTNEAPCFSSFLKLQSKDLSTR